MRGTQRPQHPFRPLPWGTLPRGPSWVGTVMQNQEKSEAYPGVREGIFQHPYWAGFPLALFLDRVPCPGQEPRKSKESGQICLGSNPSSATHQL